MTLFDSGYLPQGLALHTSMERHAGDYCLWILCMDEVAFDVLSELDLNRVRLLALEDWETPELLTVKEGRTVGEYCWTLTPFAPRFVFEADSSVQRVTYVDADLWFRKNPQPIFRELEESGKSVLITDHYYAPEYDYSEASGRFCVQFMPFVRDASEPVRKWWEERCVEWCFARHEDGKFGDQKYLDDWPERFGPLVHVLQDQELLLAPWNMTRFPIGKSVAFHFHGVRVGTTRVAIIPGYVAPRKLHQDLFQIYFNDIKAGLRELREVGFEHQSQLRRGHWLRKTWHNLKALIRLAWPRSAEAKLD